MVHAFKPFHSLPPPTAPLTQQRPALRVVPSDDMRPVANERGNSRSGQHRYSSKSSYSTRVGVRRAVGCFRTGQGGSHMPIFQSLEVYKPPENHG